MEQNLTKGNPTRLILVFAIPLLLGNLFQQIYNVVDMLIVGRTLGANALAAVGCTGSILFMVVGFVHSATAGFSIVTSQFYGAKDATGVRKSFCTTLICSTCIGVVLTLFSTLYSREILTLLRTPAEIIDATHDYLFIIFLGILFLVFFNVLSNTILAIGDSKTPLIFLIISCIINVVLDYVFILGFSWGVAGAAWATIVSQVLASLFCLLYLLKRLPILIPHREDWKLSFDDLLRSMKIGLPMGFQSVIIALGCVIVQVYLNDLGAASIAAFATANKIDLIATMPLMSFGIAMATYVGQNYGARNIRRIHEGVKQCCLLSLSYSVCIAAINIMFGHYFVQLFVGKNEPIIIDLSRNYFALTSTMYWVLSLLFVFRFTLQGVGKSFVPTVAGIMELIMRVAAALFLVSPFGFGGVCMASPLAWVGSAVPLIIAYFFIMRKLTKTIHPPPIPAPRAETIPAYPGGSSLHS